MNSVSQLTPIPPEFTAIKRSAGILSIEIHGKPREAGEHPKMGRQ
jgi:hypothetical protein